MQKPEAAVVATYGSESCACKYEASFAGLTIEGLVMLAQETRSADSDEPQPLEETWKDFELRIQVRTTGGLLDQNCCHCVCTCTCWAGTGLACLCTATGRK